VDAPFLKRYRKWAFLGAFLVAAILTPTPDPFNQCLMALPMYVFYEVGIVSAGIFGKKAAAEPRTPAAARGAGAVPMTKAAMAPGGEYLSVPDGARRR
jgi:sec-independent protein translocase protein TatC